MTSPNILRDSDLMDEVDVGEIAVGERKQTVRAYNEQGEVIDLGYVVSRRYRGEQAQRHYFVGTDEKGRTKRFKMGVTTTQFRFTSHQDVLAPLVERGWGINDVVYGRGGQYMMAILRRPDGLCLEDPIVWDHHQWAPMDRKVLHESIVVRSSIRPGRGYRYSRGIFRTICTNGLEVSILNLGNVRYSHTNWSAASVVNRMGSMAPLQEGQIWGPMVGNANGARRLAGLLESLVGEVIEGEAYNQSSRDIDDEDEAPMDKSREAALARLPFFVRNQATSIVGQPTWYIKGMAAQLRQMAESQSDIHALHVANVTTNVVNLARRETRPHAIMRPLLRAETITDSTMNLLGALSL